MYSDGGTWYPEACKVLGLKHHLHSPYEKSIIERVNQYMKDRIEAFDDYYPCTGNRKRNCDMDHIYNLVSFYVSMYNDIKTHRFRIKLRDEKIILS